MEPFTIGADVSARTRLRGSFFCFGNWPIPFSKASSTMPDPGGGIFSGRCQSQQRYSEADVSAGSLFFISSQFLEVPYEDGKRDQTVTGAHNLLKTLTPCTLWQLGSGRKSWGSGKKTQAFVLPGSAETIKFGLTFGPVPSLFLPAFIGNSV